MEYLFEALTNSAMHKLRKYLEVFCRSNKDYSVFEKIPLTPRTYSYYGSTIPLYSSWIKNLHELLDLFSGIDFIWHKKRVEDRIASLQEIIRAEEISDIIEG